MKVYTYIHTYKLNEEHIPITSPQLQRCSIELRGVFQEAINADAQLSATAGLPSLRSLAHARCPDFALAPTACHSHSPRHQLRMPRSTSAPPARARNTHPAIGQPPYH